MIIVTVFSTTSDKHDSFTYTREPAMYVVFWNLLLPFRNIISLALKRIPIRGRAALLTEETLTSSAPVLEDLPLVLCAFHNRIALVTCPNALLDRKEPCYVCRVATRGHMRREFVTSDAALKHIHDHSISATHTLHLKVRTSSVSAAELPRMSVIASGLQRGY